MSREQESLLEGTFLLYFTVFFHCLMFYYLVVHFLFRAAIASTSDISRPRVKAAPWPFPLFFIRYFRVQRARSGLLISNLISTCLASKNSNFLLESAFQFHLAVLFNNLMLCTHLGYRNLHRRRPCLDYGSCDFTGHFYWERVFRRYGQVGTGADGWG